MKQVQWLICAAAAVVLAISTPSLIAEADALYVCCDDPTDCSGDKVCCSPDILSLPACGDEGDGYCVTKCTRILTGEGQ